MNFDEILVYCDKHKGYQNCNCNEQSKHSKQTNIQPVDSKDEDESNSASKVPQVVAAVVVTLGSFSVGNALGWTSPALPRIDQSLCSKHSNKTFDKESLCDLTGITFELAGWVGPLLPIGAILVGPWIGLLVDGLGRKWSMVSLSIPTFTGWLLITLSQSSNSIINIYVGRALIGFGAGAFTLIAPMYISEIAETSLRGGLASFMQLQSNMGVTFVNALNIGRAVHWVKISWACMVVPVLLTIGLFLLPESPHHLLNKGRIYEAKESLQWLRGKRCNIANELQQLKSMANNQRDNKSISFKRLMTEGVYLKPFLITTVIMFLQQFCGVNVVIFYAETIFIKAGSSIDPGLCAFLVALCQVIGTGVAISVVDKFGRRILLILSSLLMCFSIFALGIYFFMDENKRVICTTNTLLDFQVPINNPCKENEHSDIDPEIVKNLGWVPLLALMIYIFFFSIGVGPLAWTLNAELFSPEAKTICSPITFCFNWFCAFLVTKYEPQVERYIGASGAYFLFAGICGAGTLFIYCFVPETKGKNTEEIRLLFSPPVSLEDNSEHLDTNNNQEKKSGIST